MKAESKLQKPVKPIFLIQFNAAFRRALSNILLFKISLAAKSFKSVSDRILHKAGAIKASILVYILLCSFHVGFIDCPTAQAETLTNSITEGDWDLQSTITFMATVPISPQFSVTDQNDYSNTSTNGITDINQDVAYTFAATDWVCPYVVHFDHSAFVDFSFDAESGQYSGHFCPISSFVCSTYGIFSHFTIAGVNQGLYLETGATVAPHGGPADETYTLLESIDGNSWGEHPYEFTALTAWPSNVLIVLDPCTNTGVSSYTHVTVPAMAVAFIGNSPPVFNIAPPSDAPSAGYYVDPAGPPPQNDGYHIYETVGNYPYGGTPSITFSNYSYTNTMSQAGARQVMWYGAYSNELNGAGVGVTRDPNEYYMSGCNPIGQLITYAVLPAHPKFDTNGLSPGAEYPDAITSYALQVAMQLGPVLSTQIIYETQDGCPDCSGPFISTLAFPSGIPLCTDLGPAAYPYDPSPGSTISIFGVLITDSFLTGDLEVDLSAQFGTLTLTYTNGLTFISGLGTTNLSIQGSLTNVNLALANFEYTAFTNFPGYDTIRIIADDLGHNTCRTPSTNTAMIPIIAKPSLTNGTFVSGSNFQFYVTGMDGTWNVSATTDFTNWTNIGSVSVTSSVATFVDTNAASFDHRFYKVTQYPLCSDAIGYYHRTVPGKQTNGAGGYSLIANQLIATNCNDLNVVFPSVPNQTIIYKWDTSSHGYISYTFYDGYGWFPDGNFGPGDGGYMINPTTNTAITLTYIGVVPTGPQSLTVPTNGNFISSIFPSGAPLDVLGFPAHDGDSVYLFNDSTHSYDNIITYFDGYGWFDPEHPSEPTAPVPSLGHSFYYTSGASTNRVWSQNFSVTP